MPLLCGKNNVGKNIRELISSGRNQKQAVAIALSHLRRCTSGKVSWKTGRNKNRPKRGFKTCVVNLMVKSRFRTPNAGRKTFSNAVRTCKEKFQW